VHCILGGVGRVVVCCVWRDGAFQERVAGLDCVEDVGWEVEIADTGCGFSPALGSGRWDWEDGGS